MTNRETLRSLADKWDEESARLFAASYRGEQADGFIIRDAMTATISELCKDFAASLRAIGEGL